MTPIADAARLIAIAAIETVARPLLAGGPYIGFRERVLVIEKCQKLIRLMAAEADEALRLNAQQELVALLSPHRILALAAFRGVRRGDSHPVDSWPALAATAAQNLAARFSDRFADLRKKIETQEHILKIQRESLAAGTMATLERCSPGTWATSLSKVIHAIADERDAAIAARDSLEARVADLESREQKHELDAGFVDEPNPEPEQVVDGS